MVKNAHKKELLQLRKRKFVWNILLVLHDSVLLMLKQHELYIGLRKKFWKS